MGPGMKKPHERIGNVEKAIVHIAKAQLGLTEDEYRSALADVGVATSKDLTFRQFEQLMEHFKAEGYRPLEQRRTAYVKAPAATWDREPMLKKIAGILGGLGFQWRYADSIARRMFSVDSAMWCTPVQLHSIVAALEYRRKRASGSEMECSGREERR